MVELSGLLGSTELLAIIRLLAELRQTGSLRLSHDGWSARLDLLEGRVVAASFGHERGLGALTALGPVIEQAEFVYMEGPAPAVHELDLTPEDFRGHLARPAGVCDLSLGAGLRLPKLFVPALACPKLGFADDATSHFSQPTAAHRCYASGLSKPVSTIEQRELCLSGRYQKCPRHAAAAAQQAAGANNAAGHDRMSVGTSVTPAADSGARPTDLLLPPVSIGLFIAALIAVFVVFVRPRVAAPDGVTTPVPAAVPLTPAVVVQFTPAAVAQPMLAPHPAEPTPAPTLPGAAVPQPTIPSPTPAPTIRPTPAPVLAQHARGPNAVGAMLLDALFSVPQSGWAEKPPFATWSDGAYRLNAQGPGRFVAVGAPVSERIGDVTVSGTFHKLGGPPGGGYGLILRDQEPGRRDSTNQSGNFYVLEVSDRGDVGMWRRAEDRWVDVLSWTHSDVVHPGGTTNELTARAVGDQLTLIVNGVEVARQSDSTLSVGGVGVFVGGDANDVAMNRFSVTVPGQAVD